MKRILCACLASWLLLSGLTACGQGPVGQETADLTGVSGEAGIEPTSSGISVSGEAWGVELHEVMPVGLTEEPDWVELYNREDRAVSLDGYYLTDDPDAPELLSLAGKTVPAGGYLSVPLPKNCQLQLSGGGETVYLYFHGDAVSRLTYPEAAPGESYDSNGLCQYPTPGYANTEEGYLALLHSTALPELVISEVLTGNSRYSPVRYQYYDLVEVMNNSQAPLDLSSYCLTDRWEQPRQFTFPHVILEPGDYYVVYCSAKPDLGVNHAPFSLSSAGETLYLTKDGALVDVLMVPGGLKENQSYGRKNQVPMYLSTPTPGKENTSGYLNALQAPTADVASGCYESAVTVSLQGEGTIYYTTDGSRPTVYSRVYTKPITVRDVTTIRAFCVSDGQTSNFTAFTYVVGKEHDLPVVTVAIPQDKLTGEKGVLKNIKASYEYEAVLTLIEDGVEKFSIPCGFRLHGNDSRKGAKKNFSLRFRSEYGAGKLKYPVFDNREFAEYDSLLLKGGSEDWGRAMMRDEVATGLVDGTTNLYAQAIKPVVLYLGGDYWGIYYLRERYSDFYVQTHMGVPRETVDILYSSAGYVQFGSDAEYKALLNYVRSHDMSTSENYAYLTERIDATGLMDWYVARSFVGDVDIANVRRFRSDAGDGKWRWMYFDLDWGFWHSEKPFSKIVGMFGGDGLLMRALIASPTGRDAFLARYDQLLDSVFNEESINTYIDSLIEQIGSEMPRDRARWNRSFSGWETEVQFLRDFDKNGRRTKRILRDLQTYFSLSDAQMKEYFGE